MQPAVASSIKEHDRYLYCRPLAMLEQNNNCLFPSGLTDFPVTERAKYCLAGSASLLTFIVYLTSLRNEFLLWDDDVYVTDNTFIRSFDGVFWKRAFLDLSASNWHPLAWFSHALDYAIWGLNPLGHHLTNSILHAANTFLVVFVLWGLFTAAREKAQGTQRSEFLGKRTMLIATGVASLLFGLHPIHVESVAWIAERKDVLCALFFLSSIIVYTHYVRTTGNEGIQQRSSMILFNRHCLLSLGLFFLALLSKPMAVTLPVALLLLDWYPFERIHSCDTFRTAFLEKIPFIVLSCISSVLTIIAQRSGGAIKTMEFAPLSTRLLVAAKSLVAYIGKMIVPMDLIPYYPYPKNVSLFNVEYASAIVLVIAITIACFMAAKRRKVWLMAWGYYLVTLLPVLGIVQVGNQAMADRYSYLPSLGPFVLIGLFTAEVSRNVRTLFVGRRTITLFGRITALIAVIALIHLTVQQISIWRNSIVFWNYIIEDKSKTTPFAYNNRGTSYEKLGQTDKALEDYDRAIALDPSFDKAYNNRAVIFDKKGDTDKALVDYNKAIELNPSFDKAYRVFNNRALLFEKRGLPDKALADYGRAIALKPSFDEAYYNRAVLFEKLGQPDKALADYDKAIALRPSFDTAHYKRALLFEKLGQQDKALEDYDKIIVMNPSFDRAYYNRALLFERKGQIDKAIADYDQTIAVNPSFGKAYLGRGILFSKAGSFDKAIEYIDKAIAIDHNNAEAYGTRGLVYAFMNQDNRALEDFNKALELDPGLSVTYFNRGYIYQKAGNQNLARSDFQKACKLGNREACTRLQSR